MAATQKQVVGDHPPYSWQANGDLLLFPVSVAGALNTLATTNIGLAAGAGAFDSFQECFTGLLIDTLSIRQRVDGSAGTTTVEFYRLRAGVWTFLVSVSLAFGGGGGATASAVPASVALRTLNQGDVVVAILVARQTGATDLSAKASFT